MIIILEGPDGVGKSTLAANIKAVTGGATTILRSGPPTSECTAWQHCQILIDLMARGGDFVVDRLHLGELCYGPLFRRRSTISLDEASMIDRRLVGMGALRCVLDLEPDVQSKRLMERDGGAPDPKSGASLAHARPLRAAYAGVTRSLSGWLHVDANTYPDQLATDIIAKATRLAIAPKVMRGWYGSPVAERVVLVDGNPSDQRYAGQLARMLKLCNMDDVAVVDPTYVGPPMACFRGVVAVSFKSNQRGRETGWKITETVSSLKELVKVARP